MYPFITRHSTFMPPCITNSAFSSVPAKGSRTASPIGNGVKRKRQHDEPQKAEQRVFSDIRSLDSTIPRSAFAGWTPARPASSEVEALTEVQEDQLQGYGMVNLSDFTIYRSPNAVIRPHEMVPLHLLKVDTGLDELYFDGTVWVGTHLVYLQRISFQTLAVEGYGSADLPSLTAGISIQSEKGARHNVWYRLVKPSAEYTRYHKAFLWVADLTKLVLDVLLKAELKIGLTYFRADFHHWLMQEHNNDEDVQQWLAEYGRSDFRQAIAANIHYIWKEAWDIDESLSQHQLWTETDPNRLSAIKYHDRSEHSTIVTPFIANIFRDMSFSGILETQVRSSDQEQVVARRRRQLDLTPLATLLTGLPSLSAQQRPRAVSSGDVVHVRPDANSEWKSTQKPWLAYVQQVSRCEDGRIALDLLWLYWPSHTSIGEAPYPFQNEVFMSDNCSCGADAYYLQDVVGVVAVKWRADPAYAAGRNVLTIRQTYMSDANEFVTLEDTHFRCACQDKPPSAFVEAIRDYAKGSFVLYRKGRETSQGWEEDNILEPAQLVDFVRSTSKVRLRLLPRAQSARRPNEVIWTEEFFEIPAYNLVRTCQVSGYQSEYHVSELCRRGGVGDLFYYITCDGQRPQPHLSHKITSKLRGMGICCGGGSFDRGLEDGGAITFQHAIDYDTAALHTYRANNEQPNETKCFLGPMEKYLEDCLAGKTNGHTAAIGDVDVIAAGSPCQAFSRLQPNKSSPQSLKNASLIANVLSFVEHFMPLYFYLENVVGISLSDGGTAQNMLARIICALVGLGYQVQQHVVDAPTFGSFQSRSRVILIATAPGLETPSRPPQSHLARHEGESFRKTHLGHLSNGKRFGTNSNELAPFPAVTFEEGTRDLPDLGDGHVHTCIPFPDHRQVRHLSSLQRNTIYMIPQYPRGLGLVQAHALGKIPESQAKRWLSNPNRAAASSQAFSRVRPDSFMNTVVTAPHTLCNKNGRCLHPTQNRRLTVMEARRGQGFPDHEVILGVPSTQWKIIGNSVHRNVAFALGLSLRDAWLKTQKNNAPLARKVMAPASKWAAVEPVEEAHVGAMTAMVRRVPVIPVIERAGQRGIRSREESEETDDQSKQSSPAGLKGWNGLEETVVEETTTMVVTTKKRIRRIVTSRPGLSQSVVGTKVAEATQ